jgi:preprotein translocase subunit SecG
MTILLMIVHILACLFLIAVVLLQSGKGAEIGAAFGGSSQTLFGSRGSASFLSKMTTVVAVVFMVTSLTLAVVTSKGSSVLKRIPAGTGTSIPAAPGPLQGVQPQPQSQQLPQPSQPVQQKAAQVPQPLKQQKQKTTTQTQPQTSAAPQTAPAAPAQSMPQPAQEPQLPPAK